MSDFSAWSSEHSFAPGRALSNVCRDRRAGNENAQSWLPWKKEILKSPYYLMQESGTLAAIGLKQLNHSKKEPGLLED